MVLVPVGELDRRAVLALDRAARISPSSVRAVHLCADSDAAHAFALEWATAGECVAGVPLDIIETPAHRWDDGLRALVDAHRDAAGHVAVVIGRFRLRRRWQRLLHDNSAERLRDALAGLDNVRIEFVDVVV